MIFGGRNALMSIFGPDVVMAGPLWAANKWIKKIAGSDSVIHGLRHSFRDRLRNKEVPTEVIDQLGGWSFSSIGQSYGEGYNLKILQKYIGRIID